MKLTKWVFAPPILLWLFAAQAESTASATLLELHRQDCQFSWPDPTPIAIVESTRDDISKSVVRFTFAVDLGSNSIDSKGRFLFTCFRKANEKPVLSGGLERSTARQRVQSPKQIIASEDAGGRYFRHIAWERRIAGLNWKGRVAYSDYLFGDGQKSRTNYFLVCNSSVSAPCVGFESDADYRVSAHTVNRVLELFRLLTFRPE